jgi:hypothetical protein
MRRPALATPVALLLLAAAGGAAAQTTTPSAVVPEEIGTWRLSCAVDRMTDRADCMLRHRDPVERAQAPGGSSLLLEVQNREGRMVPVVTARDLTLEAAGRGLLAVTGTVQLRFPPNPLFELPCGLEGRSLVCAPRGGDAARAAAELPAAPPVELRLEGTPEALARFRTRMPEGSAPPPAPGLTLQEIVVRLQRLLGL